MVQFVPEEQYHASITPHHTVGRTTVMKDGTKMRNGVQVACVCDEEYGERCAYHYPPHYPLERSGPYGTAKVEGSIGRGSPGEYWHITTADGTDYYSWGPAEDVQAFLDTGERTKFIHTKAAWEGTG